MSLDIVRLGNASSSGGLTRASRFIDGDVTTNWGHNGIIIHVGTRLKPRTILTDVFVKLNSGVSEKSYKGSLIQPHIGIIIGLLSRLIRVISKVA
ncbi:hypothetical protein ACFLWO_03215, partial [Chloroflexota bacterium]